MVFFDAQGGGLPYSIESDTNHPWLHLVPHHSILVIQSKIRALLLAGRQKAIHIILIQIRHTRIAFIILIIHIIDTCVTNAHLLIPPFCFLALLLLVQISINLSLSHTPILRHLLHGSLGIHSLPFIISHMLFDTHILPRGNLLLAFLGITFAL